ncbi:MAG: DUF2892 domain-containing protein [Alphaproteobacteria bacterium]|nr:DUF2892 domain-containing protein [Alphaproteobacteria bacterium]
MANVGIIDRILRLVVAAALIAYFAMSARAGVDYIALVIGGVLAVTALVGVCPAYSIFGISTKKKAAP